MLTLVATPIGNLKDMTFRAVEVLRDADYILCEDTRHSRPLLQHFEIDNKLVSYHKFNEAERLQQVLADLKSGQKIALISDAGTPGISDPGERLVQACVEAALPVSATPGPAALIQALILSGFPTEPFQFVGFLPKKKGQLEQTLKLALNYPGTSIAYESPHRINKTLETIHQLSPKRPIAVARELTKKFEQIHHGTAQELAAEADKLRGELVLLIHPPEEEEREDWTDLEPAEHVAVLAEKLGLSRNEALKLAAEQRGVSRRDLYKLIADAK